MNSNDHSKDERENALFTEAERCTDLDGAKKVLLVLRRAEQRLAKCTELTQVMELRSDAELMRVFSDKRHLGLRMQNYAAKIKLQAERKLGEALAAMNLRGGDRKTKYPKGTLNPQLRDLGISRKQSSRWQYEASISTEEFDAFCRELERRGEEICSSALLRFIRSVHRVEPSVHRSGKRRVFVDFGAAAPSRSGDHACTTCTEALSEIRNHLYLLKSMFTDICRRKSDDLKPIERQQIPQYMRDIIAKVEDIESCLAIKTPKQSTR